MANVLNLNLNYYKALSDGNINLLELIFKQSDATLLVLVRYCWCYLHLLDNHK